MTVEYCGPVSIHMDPNASFSEEKARIVEACRPQARVLPPGFYDITPEDMERIRHILQVHDDLTGSLYTKQSRHPSRVRRINETTPQQVIYSPDEKGMSVRGVIYYRKD